MADSQAQKDIASAVAALASHQSDISGMRKLTGAERAAVLMLALGETHGAKI